VLDGVVDLLGHRSISITGDMQMRDKERRTGGGDGSRHRLNLQ
jgi:hypothetical protein